jgi:hypothetical protein
MATFCTVGLSNIKGLARARPIWLAQILDVVDSMLLLGRKQAHPNDVAVLQAQRQARI